MEPVSALVVVMFASLTGIVGVIVGLMMGSRDRPHITVDTSELAKAVEPKAGALMDQLSEVVNEELGMYTAFRDDMASLMSQVLGSLRQLDEAIEKPFDIATQIENARGVAWRMEAACNRALRFLHYVATAAKEDELRERATGVLVDMKAIMEYANEAALKEVLERHPDWTPHDAGRFLREERGETTNEEIDRFEKEIGADEAADPLESKLNTKPHAPTKGEDDS